MKGVGGAGQDAEGEGQDLWGKGRGRKEEEGENVSAVRRRSRERRKRRGKEGEKDIARRREGRVSSEVCCLQLSVHMHVGREEGRKVGGERRASPPSWHTHTHIHTSLQPSWCGCPPSPPGRQTSTRKVPSNKGWARSKAALLALLPLLLKLSLLLPCIEEEKEGEAKAVEGGAIVSWHGGCQCWRSWWWPVCT